MFITDKQFIYPCDDSPSLGTQYTGPSSLLSKEEKDSWDDQEEGEGCSATEGGSMKLQLKVFSGSWWATENRKQTAQPKGQPKGIVPPHKNNSLFSLTRTTAADLEQVNVPISLWKNWVFFLLILHASKQSLKLYERHFFVFCIFML